MVVTDDQGRYVIPDLPTADYEVWVRGYGLVDSPKVRAKPGQQLNLAAVPAPTAAEAAKYYPAIYWYSMMKIPPASEFGGKSDIPAGITQDDWLRADEQRRLHRLPSARPGSDAHDPGAFGPFRDGARGLDAPHSVRPGGRADDPTALPASSAACPTSISATGPTASPRANCRRASRRVRRASSATSSSPSWEWSTEKNYLHDLIASDRRYPTVNAYGPLYGSPEYSTDNMPILDPKTNKVVVLQDAGAGPEHARIARSGTCRPRSSRCSRRPIGATRRSGTPRPTTTTPCSTRRAGCGSRPACAAIDNPAFCKKGSDHPSAKVFPLDRVGAPGRRCSTPRRMKYYLRRHLLRHAPSAVRL